jgi:hypothetical protein
MAQGIVTYKSGALANAAWIEGGANPNSKFYFKTEFGVGVTASAVDGPTAGYTQNSSTTTCTSLVSLCASPSSLVFEALVKFIGTGASGAAGLAAVAANTIPTLGTTAGIYFRKVANDIVLTVKGSGTDNIVVAPFTTNAVRLGFHYEAGVYSIYLDGELAVTKAGEMPSNALRALFGGSASGNNLECAYLVAGGDR